MRFEWDGRKATPNLVKHRISFAMKEHETDRPVALAAFAVAYMAAAAACTVCFAQIGWSKGALTAMCGAILTSGTWGACLVLPFAILGLRRTRIKLTIPLVGIPTILAASFCALVNVAYSWIAALATGLVAILGVHLLRRHLTTLGRTAPSRSTSRAKSTRC